MEEIIFYFKIGWQHILSWDALDHLLFLTALTAIYSLKEWKQVLILITAFTIGHSLTLVLSVLEIVRFQTNWVEFLIPCTIIFTALFNLFQKNAPLKKQLLNYILALLFGLIHGMGYANTIRFMLASDQTIGKGLLGFNFGLEAGQLIVVLSILFTTFILTYFYKINRRELLIFLSAASFALALKIAIERFSSILNF